MTGRDTARKSDIYRDVQWLPGTQLESQISTGIQGCSVVARDAARKSDRYRDTGMVSGWQGHS